MSEQLRPWRRPPKSSRFVSKAMIERACLTPFQVAMIEETLLEQEVKRIRHDIDFYDRKRSALMTADGLEEERRKIACERDVADQALEELLTEKGLAKAVAFCENMMESYELQNVEREKILETLRKQRENHV